MILPRLADILARRKKGESDDNTRIKERDYKELQQKGDTGSPEVQIAILSKK